MFRKDQLPAGSMRTTIMRCPIPWCQHCWQHTVTPYSTDLLSLIKCLFVLCVQKSVFSSTSLTAEKLLNEDMCIMYLWNQNISL